MEIFNVETLLHSRWSSRLLFITLLAVLLHHAWSRFKYHQAQTIGNKQQVPPAYPSNFPGLGNLISLAWNARELLAAATCYKGSLTSTKLSIMGFELYIFQDRETIVQIMRHPTLASPMSLYVFGMRLLFGMPQKGVESYVQDDSGPSFKPFPGSKVAPKRRVDFMLHKAFNQAWAGRSMAAASQRFMKLLGSHMDLWGVQEEWVDVDDFFKFVGSAVSNSVTETVFGPALLKLNPDLIESAWAFDNSLPWMFRQVPRFLMPEPYRLRKKMSLQIRRWYAYARQWFTESSIYPDGDGDPFWGSEVIRTLQKELLQNGDRGFIDDECFAAHDLGLIWGSNSNVIAAATLAAFHIFSDQTLLQRVRAQIKEHLDNPLSPESIGYKQLWEIPLLASIQAEVLRLYVDVLLIFSSPHEDALLGRWRLPRGKKALVSTFIAHRDEKAWNTQEGLHPLDSFWAERFIIDPLDPSTGPLNQRNGVRGKRVQNGKPYFSTEGLEGLWIPFGGGPSMCPGRFLAKTIVMQTCALLVTRFDIELDGCSLEFAPRRFGLGVAKPKSIISTRIRRRME